VGFKIMDYMPVFINFACNNNSITGRGRDSSLGHHILTGSGAQQFFLGVKAAGE
jgi:hypothetical protein